MTTKGLDKWLCAQVLPLLQQLQKIPSWLKLGRIFCFGLIFRKDFEFFPPVDTCLHLTQGSGSFTVRHRARL